MRNVTDVDDDILRRPASSACTTSTSPPRRWRGSTPTWGARPPAGLLRAAGDVGHPRHPVAHRRWRSRAVTPTRPAGLGLLQRGELPRLRPAQRLRTARDARASPPSTGATPTTRTSATRSTSCSGSPRCPTSRRGSRAGDRAGPAGTSSARRWRCASSGETIDVHGGGRDLVFPHHECETAQSESATGEPFVRLWIHVGLVRLDGDEDVQVARQPRLRRGPVQGVGPCRGAARAARPPLPRGLGLATGEDMPAAAARLARLVPAPRLVTATRRASTRCAPRSTRTSTPRAHSRRSTMRPPPAGRSRKPRACWASRSDPIGLPRAVRYPLSTERRPDQG